MPSMNRQPHWPLDAGLELYDLLECVRAGFSGNNRTLTHVDKPFQPTVYPGLTWDQAVLEPRLTPRVAKL
jgi:hypothetical protein